jgi:single-strand DNA-binding protein
MANVNKVMLIGRLTRDPETRSFASGGKVVAFGFAVTNRKKDQQSGQWVDDPMFIDCKIFGGAENSRQADLAAQSLRMRHQVFLEGHLVFEQWEDKNGGGKRSKHVLVVDNFQFLEKKEDAGGGSFNGGGGYQKSKPAASGAGKTSGPPPSQDYDDEPPAAGNHGGEGDEIPF